MRSTKARLKALSAMLPHTTPRNLPNISQELQTDGYLIHVTNSPLKPTILMPMIYPLIILTFPLALDMTTRIREGAYTENIEKDVGIEKKIFGILAAHKMILLPGQPKFVWWFIGG